ncbi:MAG: hypothetical protein RIQ36_664 [Pseudomonadota bacterium]|jgi:hypothetical protein
MKKLLITSGLLLSTSLVLAQPQKPTYAYFEGFNLSMGVAQNSTEAIATTSTKTNTSLALAKLNYTFALAYPAKLGITATMDLKSSKVSDTENLAVNGPSEVSIEPGVLLLSNSLLYGKVGSYSSRYESGSNPTRNLTGTSVGVGIKHYIYGQNFIQAEWTQRKADDNGAGLAGIKFKQTSAAVMVGFNF